MWWDTITSYSKFWRWARLRVDPGLYRSQAEGLLTSSILYLVSEIRICPRRHWYHGYTYVDSLLQAVAEGNTPNLKKIQVASADLLTPSMLVEAARKVEELEFEVRPRSWQIDFIRTFATNNDVQDSTLKRFIYPPILDPSMTRMIHLVFFHLDYD